MSTRCNIHFTYMGEVEANVYRHCDGYPEGESGVPADLARFFADVESQTKDTRFGDPAYLAAKFIVWQAGEYAADKAPLDFIGLGVMTEDAGDGAYTYTVECGPARDGTRPVVTWCRPRVDA